jgi:hypothetical protein
MIEIASSRRRTLAMGDEKSTARNEKNMRAIATRATVHRNRSSDPIT